MARTTKNRKICYIPNNKVFRPEDANGDIIKSDDNDIVISYDELEAIRLCDLEELDQDTAATRMEVSRATFQRILYSARKNIASALVNGNVIQIKGGSYFVADNHCDCESSCSNCRFDEKA